MPVLCPRPWAPVVGQQPGQGGAPSLQEKSACKAGSRPAAEPQSQDAAWPPVLTLSTRCVPRSSVPAGWVGPRDPLFPRSQAPLCKEEGGLSTRHRVSGNAGVPPGLGMERSRHDPPAGVTRRNHTQVWLLGSLAGDPCSHRAAGGERGGVPGGALLPDPPRCLASAHLAHTCT